MGLFDKLGFGLKKTKDGIFNSITKSIISSPLTDELYDELLEQLILADVGYEVSEYLCEELRREARKRKAKSGEDVVAIFQDIVVDLLSTDKEFDISGSPAVILIIGVNGVGKTTTIGKLAWQFKQAGLKVMLGAADTFRAAAVEQISIWGERIDVPVVKQKMGSDPASVAYDTLSSAIASGVDVVLIDTAGRLHNKKGLMDELSKIKRVMQKLLPDAPHDVMLVLDGSTGQNAFEQAKQFTSATEVTSMAITKLDGSAKGGVVIGISDQFKIPVRYIGLGERAEDLQPFNRREFVDSLFKK